MENVCGNNATPGTLTEVSVMNSGNNGKITYGIAIAAGIALINRTGARSPGQ
jgi:hypothetical protein